MTHAIIGLLCIALGLMPWVMPVFVDGCVVSRNTEEDI